MKWLIFLALAALSYYSWDKSHWNQSQSEARRDVPMTVALLNDSAALPAKKRSGDRFSRHEPQGDAQHDVTMTAAPPRGFVTLPENDLNPAGIIIISPPDCSPHGRKRSDRLAERLSQLDIPYTYVKRIRFFSHDLDDFNSRIRPVMKGAKPIVVVKGKAKANPSIEDVIAEYEDS